MPKYRKMTPRIFAAICEFTADAVSRPVQPWATSKIKETAQDLFLHYHPDDVNDVVEGALESWARLQVEPPKTKRKGKR